MSWIVLLCVVLMLIAAVAVQLLREPLAAIAAAAAVSLMLSAVFALLRAPDVALAEAAVGSGLSGVMLALTALRLSRQQRRRAITEQEGAS